jgi:hypothetical protein
MDKNTVEYLWAESIPTTNRPTERPEQPEYVRLALDIKAQMKWIWLPDQQEWFEFW